MANSERFGFINIGNFRVFVDKMSAFQKFLELGVDTVIGLNPEKLHISQFCVDNSYKGRAVPKNWVKDEKDGGYWEMSPTHYWLETSEEPLEVCIVGSGRNVDVERVKKGRETFAKQGELVARVLGLVGERTFEKDVLPHIPFGEMRGNDINEDLLQKIISIPVAGVFDMSNFGEDSQIITGEDLRGIERMGYTITQNYIKEGEVLEIGLCKAYYPK